MPTKVKDVFVPFAYTTGTTVSTATQRVSRRMYWQDTRTGVSNKNWKTQVRYNTQAGTGMSAGKTSLEVAPGNAFYYEQEGTTNPWGASPALVDVYGSVAGQYATPAIIPSLNAFSDFQAKQQALSRLYASIRSQRTSMQAGVTAGEMKSTIEGISSLTKSFARNFKSHLRSQQRMLIPFLGRFKVGPNGSPVRDRHLTDKVRKDPTTAERLEHELRDGYLQFSLGVRPLVADVKSLAETLARWQFDHSHTRVRGYGKEERFGFTRTDLEYPYGPIKALRNIRRWSECEVIYRAGLSTDVDSPAWGSAHRLYQLLGAYDLENWVPTIWNLMPYSFVVDYVTNVADVVGAMVTDTSRVQWVVCTTIKSTWEEARVTVQPEQSVVVGSDGKPRRKSQGGDLGGYRVVTRSVNRTVESGLELPQLTFNLPSTRGMAIPNLFALFGMKGQGVPSYAR